MHVRLHGQQRCGDHAAMRLLHASTPAEHQQNRCVKITLHTCSALRLYFASPLGLVCLRVGGPQFLRPQGLPHEYFQHCDYTSCACMQCKSGRGVDNRSWFLAGVIGIGYLVTRQKCWLGELLRSLHAARHSPRLSSKQLEQNQKSFTQSEFAKAVSPARSRTRRRARSRRRSTDPGQRRAAGATAGRRPQPKRSQYS